MLKKFNQYFKSFINERVTEVDEKILYNNKKYREIGQQIIQIQDDIHEKLPARSKQLVNQYDEADAEEDGILSETMYRQGLIDGIKLARFLDRCGIT